MADSLDLIARLRQLSVTMRRCEFDEDNQGAAWVDEAVAALSAPIFQPADVERLRSAVEALPWVAERVAKGQQFNCYDAASNDDDDADEDREFYVCIGPVTDFRLIGEVTGYEQAQVIEAGLKLATAALAVIGTVQTKETGDAGSV